MNAPRVLAFTGSESGCTLWRTYWPFTELQRRGMRTWFRPKDSKESDAPEWPFLVASRLDAVILPRMTWAKCAPPVPEGVDLIDLPAKESDWPTWCNHEGHIDYEAGVRYFNAMHRAGLTIIYEIDDDAFSPAIVQRQYNTHEVERVKGLEQLEQDRLDRIYCMAQCDGVTVTTQRLKTIVSQYTDAPIEVVPNAIAVNCGHGGPDPSSPFCCWKHKIQGVKRTIPPLTIGWAGGNRYPEDLYPVAEAWGRIARRYPAVRFVVQGYIAQEIIDCVPADRLTVIPWQPLERYPVGLINIDIGCCAVAPKLFNTAKTPIKLWELTLSGATCVVSPTLYGPVTTDGEDGLIAESADEWEAALSRLVEDEAFRRTLYRNQRRRTVTEHSLEANWQNWPRAWSNIIEEHRASRSLSGLALAS